MRKHTLVIGASLKEERYSNRVIKALTAKNVETVAFGLRQGEVAGVMIDTVLMAYENIHTVTLYLNPKRQEAYYNYIISLQPKRVIFNPGTENTTFQELLKTESIDFEESCTLVLLATNQY